jgi:hypothetical protein
MTKQTFLAMAIAVIVVGTIGCSGGSTTTPPVNSTNTARSDKNVAGSPAPEAGRSPNANTNSNLAKKDEKPKPATLEPEVECVSGDGGVSSRVKFAPGKSSTTITCAVIRGDRDIYILGAKAGQKMTVNITSLEKNAVFQIENPDGEYLEKAGEGDDQTKWSGTLPDPGDYKIIVGGTRGNATYKLSITIK